MNRRAMLIVSALLLLGALFLMIATALPAQSVMPTPVATAGVYADPQGRFTVPVPANWSVRQIDGYGVLTDPDGEITMYVLALESDDIDTAIETAWYKVNPAFDPIHKIRKALPAIDGVKQVRAITYQAEDKNRYIQGLGQRYEGTVYLMLIEAPFDAVHQRRSQVMVIQTGYTIAALNPVDLSQVEPLPLTKARLADFERYIDEVRQRFNLPGAAVAVVPDK